MPRRHDLLFRLTETVSLSLHAHSTAPSRQTVPYSPSIKDVSTSAFPPTSSTRRRDWLRTMSLRRAHTHTRRHTGAGRRQCVCTNTRSTSLFVQQPSTTQRELVHLEVFGRLRTTDSQRHMYTRVHARIFSSSSITAGQTSLRPTRRKTRGFHICTHTNAG